MMSMMKKRREAERNKKLEEQFVKKDANRNGRINAEQMVQIFKDNEVQGTVVKFIYSEKTTKFCEISTNYLTDIIGGDFAKFCGLLRIYEL